MDIKTMGYRVYVKVPYHPDFSRRAAKELGGRWDVGKQAWIFSAHDEDHVRRMCREVYGHEFENKLQQAETVTLRHTLQGGIAAEYWFADRLVARRPGRDAEVQLGDGVTIVEGAFAPRSGSVETPAIQGPIDAPVVVEIRDVPRELIHPLMLTEGTWIVSEDVTDRRAALEVRREKLQRELEQVQAQLDELAGAVR